MSVYCACVCPCVCAEVRGLVASLGIKLASSGLREIAFTSENLANPNFISEVISNVLMFAFKLTAYLLSDLLDTSIVL